MVQYMVFCENFFYFFFAKKQRFYKNYLSLSRWQEFLEQYLITSDTDSNVHLLFSATASEGINSPSYKRPAMSFSNFLFLGEKLYTFFSIK